MVDESVLPESGAPAGAAPRSGKRPRDPELDAKIQQMLIELEPYRGRVFNGPISYEHVAAVLGGSSGAAIVAREWIRQRGETKRERLRQDGMTQRAQLTGQPKELPDPDVPACGDGAADRSADRA